MLMDNGTTNETPRQAGSCRQADTRQLWTKSVFTAVECRDDGAQTRLPNEGAWIVEASVHKSISPPLQLQVLNVMLVEVNKQNYCQQCVQLGRYMQSAARDITMST